MAVPSAGRPAEPSAPQQTLSPADGLAQLSFLVYGILERRAREHELSMIQIRLLVAYAADHGIDLFATIDTGRPPAGG